MWQYVDYLPPGDQWLEARRLGLISASEKEITAEELLERALRELRKARGRERSY